MKKPVNPGRAFTLVLLPLIVTFAGCKGKSEEERLAEAQKLLAQSNTLGAIIHFKDFLKKFPDSPHAQRARFDLSYAYAQERDYEKARELLRVITENAGGVDSQEGLNALILTMDTYELQEDYAKALEIALENAGSVKSVREDFHQFFRRRTANLLVRNERTTEAMNLYREMIDIESDETEYYIDPIRLLAIQVGGEVKEDSPVVENVDKAISIYKERLEKRPDYEWNSVLWYDVASLYLSTDRKEEAEAAFDEAERLIRKRVEESVGADEKSMQLFELAQVREARGRSDGAREIFAEIIHDYPMGSHRPSAMRMLAENLLIAGRTQEALKLLEELYTGYEQHPQGLQAHRRAREIRQILEKAALTSGTQTLEAPPPAADAATSGTEPVESGEPDHAAEAEKN